MLVIEGLLHPRAAPSQTRVGTLAGAKPADPPLTLGQPRFWSADSPAAAIDTADADNAEAEAVEAEGVRHGGCSAWLNRSAEAVPPAAVDNQRQTLADASGAKEEQEFEPSLAALRSAAAVDHATTHGDPDAGSWPQSQAVHVAPTQKQEVRMDDHCDAADAAESALASPEAPPARAQPVATLAAVKAPEAPALAVPNTFQDSVDSDSEGPMPSIDSGPSDSDTDE